MDKKKKYVLLAAFAVILLVAGIAGTSLNRKNNVRGNKTVQVEVVSDRDDFREIKEYQTDAATFGNLIREQLDFITYEDSDYGIFITGVHDMQQDMDQQYWWCITVDDEKTSYGADQLELKDGSKYTLTLLQGWD